MINDPSITALVPMRHYSERVPGKNFRTFVGQPLYHCIIKTLLDCPEVTQICIDTDSSTIIEDAQTRFPNVRILLRPEHLRSGMTPMNKVLMNTVEYVDADYYLQTHSTNPLLKTETISKAINTFLQSREHDSLFSVTRLQMRLFDKNHNSINHDPKILQRTQDLPPVYEENSNLYIFAREVLKKYSNRIGANPFLFEIPRNEAWDIDEEIDFIIAEAMMKNRKMNPTGL